jgi:hypothetical protein
MDGIWNMDGKIEEIGAGLGRECGGEKQIICWKFIWKAATAMELSKWQMRSYYQQVRCAFWNSSYELLMHRQVFWKFVIVCCAVAFVDGCARLLFLKFVRDLFGSSNDYGLDRPGIKIR